MLQWLVLMVGALLTGCAGARFGASEAQSDEPISVQPSQSAGYDYLVIVRDRPNSNFDPNDQQARDLAALAKLKDQCDAPRIVGETVVKSDGNGFAGEARRYEVKVRC